MSQPILPDRISVIMPCYNAATFVEEAVACVMNQSYADVELVVVDDGSTDGSVEILQRLAEQYAPRLLLLHQYRLGQYPARNLGLNHAQGARVAFLDADDYWTLDILEKLASAMDAGDADLAYCGWQNVGEGGPGTKPYVPPDYNRMDTVAEFLRSCPWPIHAALVKREAIDAVKGFSERCLAAMDYDLWLRLYALPLKIVQVPEVMAFYRWHDMGQVSKTKWKQVLASLQVRQEFVAQHPELVAHLPDAKVRELSDGYLMSEAYRAYWQRNLFDAQKLFRRALVMNLWKAADLKYLLPALLPKFLFQWLVRMSDLLRNRT